MENRVELLSQAVDMTLDQDASLHSIDTIWDLIPPTCWSAVTMCLWPWTTMGARIILTSGEPPLRDGWAVHGIK